MFRVTVNYISLATKYCRSILHDEIIKVLASVQHSNHEVAVNHLLVNSHLNVSHQLHSLSQFVGFQGQYHPMYNHIPAVAQVEEHQGPDSVKQTNTEIC